MIIAISQRKEKIISTPGITPMHHIRNETDVYSRYHMESLWNYKTSHENIQKHMRIEYNILFLFAKHNYMYEARYSFR